MRINLLHIPRRIAPIQIVKAAALSWFRDRAPSMGAAIAYYTIFSLAPMLWLISAIVGLAFGESAARGAIEQQLQYAIGEDAARAQTGTALNRERGTARQAAQERRAC